MRDVPHRVTKKEAARRAAEKARNRAMWHKGAEDKRQARAMMKKQAAQRAVVKAKDKAAMHKAAMRRAALAKRRSSARADAQARSKPSAKFSPTSFGPIKPVKRPNTFAGRAEIFHRSDALARLSKGNCPNCGKSKMLATETADFMDLSCRKCRLTVVVGRRSPLGFLLAREVAPDLICASNHSITR